VAFSSRDKEELIGKLKAYFKAELDQELGTFDAGFLLDFIGEKLGPYFYNQGLYDAQAILAGKLEEVENAILEIEKPLK